MWWNKKLVQSITLIYIALWQCSSLLIITATNIHLLNLQENKITNNVWYTESSCLLTFTNFFYFVILIYFCKQLHRVPNMKQTFLSTSIWFFLTNFCLLQSFPTPHLWKNWLYLWGQCWRFASVLQPLACLILQFLFQSLHFPPD